VKKPSSPMRSVRLGLWIVVGLLIYAYGFQVTNVNLDEIQSETRQTRLQRIIRALFRPDLFEYDREEFQVTVPVYVPCPAGGMEPAAPPTTSDPYLVVTPPCADPRTDVTVEGFNFEPNTEGPLNFIPPSGVSLKMTDVATDGEGHFVVSARLPNRPETVEQTIRAVTRRNVGLPHFSPNAINTWEKIIETVFLALLATTLATALAVPISFFAARNLMKDVTTSLTSVALAIIAWPVGIWLGALLAGWLGMGSQRLMANVGLQLGGVVLSPLLIWGAARWAVPPEEKQAPRRIIRWARMAAMGLAVAVGLVGLFLLADLASDWGTLLRVRLGVFGFLGEFVADLGDIISLLIAPIAAIATGAVLGSLAGRAGQQINERLSGAPWLALHYGLGTVGGAVLGLLIGAAIGWLYEIANPLYIRTLPVIVGAAGGLLMAFRTRHRRPIGIGLTIYYIVRTILNAVRSIEALIVALVMVVWVGLGPFAGSLALALHSIAAGGKLYSEQVESIMAGPLEAIKASGATRLQTIIYAVIPQIIPPYISFTMYRWDINVRMSTIIGLVGGGGIGFLLQQNMNLLNYRGASAQILAIAIVVATMDYLSSRLRERAI